MSAARTRRRTYEDGRPGLLERLLDPDRERPILKAIIAAVAPILIHFLTNQLPLWLAHQSPPNEPDDEEDIA